MFYSFPYDKETALSKGMNEIHALAELVKRSTKSACDSNYAILDDTVNEYDSTQYKKRSENAEVKHKSNEDWRIPTKCVHTTHFCK